MINEAAASGFFDKGFWQSGFWFLPTLLLALAPPAWRAYRSRQVKGLSERLEQAASLKQGNSSVGLAILLKATFDICFAIGKSLIGFLIILMPSFNGWANLVFDVVGTLVVAAAIGEILRHGVEARFVWEAITNPQAVQDRLRARLQRIRKEPAQP